MSRTRVACCCWWRTTSARAASPGWSCRHHLQTCFCLDWLPPCAAVFTGCPLVELTQRGSGSDCPDGQHLPHTTQPHARQWCFFSTAVDSVAIVPKNPDPTAQSHPMQLSLISHRGASRAARVSKVLSSSARRGGVAARLSLRGGVQARGRFCPRMCECASPNVRAASSDSMPFI